MDEAGAAAAAAAEAEAEARATTCTTATNASPPPVTATTIIGDDDDADRVVGATAAATGAATVVAASAAGAAAAAAGVVTSGFSTSTKKRTNSNNMPVTTAMTAAAAGEAPSPSTNEKRSQQLMLARERGGPRFFGPCPVVNSDAIWDEICICHQSAQYHLAEYSRLHRSLHMTPTNLMPTVAAEDDIDLDNSNHNKIVRVEDLSSSPDAWRLKVERDFAMRDLRVVRDRLEVVAGARPRLSRGAVSLSAISAVGLLAANHFSLSLFTSSTPSTSTTSTTTTTSPSSCVFSSGLVVSLLVSVLYQIAPWLRRALAGYCASSVTAVLERLRDFGALPSEGIIGGGGGGGGGEAVQYWWFLSTARWLEVLRWLPSADGGVY